MNKFRVIVADPPWSFQDSLTMSDVKRGAEANYKVMTIKDIINLPISDFADPKGSILALWVPSSLLQEGLDTMKAWGFTHKQTYVWVKTKKVPFTESINGLLKGIESAAKSCGYSKKHWKYYFTATMKSLDGILAFGMGRLFRQTHEICLIGTNNNLIYKHLKNKSQRSVSFGENLRHSAKPDDLQESLEIMFPKGKKMELFARRIRPGWVCLGNEICNGEDILDSLSKL
jgi:N6-adenosine-specific RNA methylase IME4